MSSALFWGLFCCCCSAWNLAILDYLACYCEVRIILLDFVYCNLLYRSRERKKNIHSRRRTSKDFSAICVCVLYTCIACGTLHTRGTHRRHSSGGVVLCIQPALSVDSTFRGKDQNELQNYCYIEYKTS